VSRITTSAVVAHSAGAVLAAALAARHPTRVASLLLVGLPAYPDARSAHQSVGRLGLLARLTVENNPAARVLCQTMCRYQSLAIALAPFVIRDLPPAIASDAARHTWASYSRTLQRVVVDHRAVEDVVATPMPVTLLHGGNDQAAPVSFVEALSERAALRPQPVQLQLVDGDHHLAVRQPAVVAAALSAMRTGGST